MAWLARGMTMVELVAVNSPVAGLKILIIRYWAWFIPLDKDVVSVGMVTPRADFLAKKQTPEEFFREDLYTINPEVERRIPKLNLVEKVHVIPELLLSGPRLLRERLYLHRRCAPFHRSDIFLRTHGYHA